MFWTLTLIGLHIAFVLAYSTWAQRLPAGTREKKQRTLWPHIVSAVFLLVGIAHACLSLETRERDESDPTWARAQGRVEPRPRSCACEHLEATSCPCQPTDPTDPSPR